LYSRRYNSSYNTFTSRQYKNAIVLVWRALFFLAHRKQAECTCPPIDNLLYATWSNRFYTVSCNESSCLTISCRCITRIAKGLFHPYDVFRMTYDLKNRSFLMRFLSLGGMRKKSCIVALFLALSLSPGNSLVSSWCDHSMP